MASQAAILVIEDDPHIRRVLATSLENEGHYVLTAPDGQTGLELASEARPKVVILDLGLPDIDGLDLIDALRKAAEPEILVLSARGAEDIKVRALDLGADDYLVKPFGSRELLARVAVATRRAARSEPAPERVELEALGVSVDIARRQVLRDGEPIHLTPIEFRLLATLLRHRDKILTHEQLLTAVWGAEQSGNTQYLRIYLGGLRRKLERNPAQPKALLTIPGVGYRLATSARA